MSSPIRSINPSRPSDVVDEFEPAGIDVVGAAVDRAWAALRPWRHETAGVRGRALDAIADDLEDSAEELARLVVREVGKPISEARAEVARAVAIWRYYGQIILAGDGETYPPSSPGSWLIARRYPLGICALITPWNFPMAIPSWKAAPAIGYGNVAILKPASAGTATARALIEIAGRHLPDGVLGMLAGGSATGQALVEHPEVAALSFTGSLAVGRMLAEKAARAGKRAQCEMGGQNPSVVLAGADLERAASTIAYAAMGYAGQKCTATRRVIAEASVYEEMRDRLVETIEALQVTRPEEESCLVGPMIEEQARSAVVEALTQQNGHVLTGGGPLDDEGFYLAPALVETDDRTSILAREEVFGPVTALLRAGSADEAIDMANDVRYGLVAAVFTRDLGVMTRLTEQLEAGLIRVNAATTGVDFHAPFGGTKASSLGPREQGFAARDFYTETTTVLIGA